MIYWDLFFGFLRVGSFSFGGAYGAIPLIRDVVMSYGWLSEERLAYMIAVSESTPGPIMVNLATYVGNSQGGFAGAVLATFAVVLPAFLIILLIMAVLKNVLKNPYVQATLRGLKPCVIGVVLSTGTIMIFRGLYGGNGTDGNIQTFVITLILACLMFVLPNVLKKKISPITLIVAAAVCGIVLY